MTDKELDTMSEFREMSDDYSRLTEQVRILLDTVNEYERGKANDLCESANYREVKASEVESYISTKNIRRIFNTQVLSETLMILVNHNKKVAVEKAEVNAECTNTKTTA